MVAVTFVSGFIAKFMQNVKEHATLSAGASVDHGVEVESTEEHVNRATDRGCCVSTCWALFVLLEEGNHLSVLTYFELWDLHLEECVMPLIPSRPKCLEAV